MKNKGFTLIELLVVIAIIGILSAIVLASLDTARNKGVDAAARADLDDARAQAENFYDSQSPNTYVGVCTTAATGIVNMLNGAANDEGTTVGGSGGVTCNSSASAWAAETSLKNAINGASNWCVDSTGTSTPRSAALSSNTNC